MNSYMLLMTDGTSEEVEAEFYHVDGEDLVSMAAVKDLIPSTSEKMLVAIVSTSKRYAGSAIERSIRIRSRPSRSGKLAIHAA